MKTITFKSIPNNYRKEYLGLKRNTIRSINDMDIIRKEILYDFINGLITNLSIEIVNSETKESFVRVVTDVSDWMGDFIISW